MNKIEQPWLWLSPRGNPSIKFTRVIQLVHWYRMYAN